jgi:hypothetical protein
MKKLLIWNFEINFVSIWTNKWKTHQIFSQKMLLQINPWKPYHSESVGLGKKCTINET